MQKISALLIFLVIPCALLAQQGLPLNQNIRFEVLTDSLYKNSKDQTLTVRIECSTAAPGQRYNLNLIGISGRAVLVEASREDEKLWLIQSENAGNNPAVLAWHTVDDTRIQVVPPDWAAPYSLEVILRLSLNNLKDIQNTQSAQIDLTLMQNNLEYRTSATGRGNLIGLR